MTDEYILKADHITVQFPGVKALDDVQLHIRKGTVHALMGENGAGKSTLMKCLIGINHPEEGGTILFKGKVLQLANPHDALSNGIAMIHQELSPIPEMTVAENIYLGRETMHGPFINRKAGIERTEQLLKRLNIPVKATEKMKNLSMANTQMIEIAKAISYDADLVIMDEPTSAITEVEVQHLFRMIADMKAQGISIIYITHKMDEVFAIADDITVLRDGQFIAAKPASELNKEQLINLMVGRELSNIFQKQKAEIGEPVLSIRNFTRKKEFRNVSFDVHRGEIVGMAGLMGAGRSELMMSLFGVTKRESGEVWLHGEKVDIRSPKDAIRHKMAFLTEDRKLTGLYLILSVQENITMASIDQFIDHGMLRYGSIRETCEAEVKKFNIRTPSIDQRVELLSGGNQQKVLLSRWMLTDPDILILDEPTRGIDIGAKSEIYKLMSDLAQQGKAIIMISSELPEIIGMSDRVVVMHEGKVTGILDAADATQERLLSYAAGESDDYREM
ncbi:MAG: sugar ABC transporter ATP-binding protein [Butyricicoccus sp.]|nr:sugar ABC transporter ATP-binding protein [Butyricicoccus sp.]